VLAAGRAADGLLAVSAAMRDDMIALGMPGERIAVHHTGIDHSRFAPAPRAPAKAALGVTGPLVVSVGALIPRKGQAFAVRAMAQLPEARLALIGEGEDRPLLEKLAWELGVADRVHLLGSLPHGEIAHYLQAADLAVLPSASEGLANAWIEALACGTPLIITDAGGAREVVKSDAAGRIVARDADAIAAAIHELLSAPPRREAVAATVADYSWQANGAALVAHWRHLIKAAA
jgi:glycosyltransferase involved in cell wall biosynthesis